MKYDRVQIMWEDPTNREGWHDFEKDPLKAYHLKVNITVGYLVAEDDNYVIIAGTVGAPNVDPLEDGEDYWSDIFTIPKVLIKESVKLTGAIPVQRSPNHHNGM